VLDLLASEKQIEEERENAKKIKDRLNGKIKFFLFASRWRNNSNRQQRLLLRVRKYHQEQPCSVHSFWLNNR
jgi:hypothetical protein